MKYRWQESTLGEICTFLTGKAFPKNEQGLKEGAYPFIKVSDMNLPKNYKKIHTAQNWISKETALRLKIKLAPKGACVFAKIGEAIKSERIRELTRDTAIDNNLMAAIPKNNFEGKYLQYLLESIHIAHYAEGSALPYLRQKNLELIHIIIPPKEIYLKIIKIINALDDKIETNFLINDNLVA